MHVKQLLSVSIGFMLLWLLVVLDLFPIGLPSFLYRIVVLIPFIALVSFGFYSLFYLVYKVINLKDCPEAQVELQGEIERIRRDPRYQALFRTTGTSKTSTVR